jgi:hypothetical protein
MYDLTVDLASFRPDPTGDILFPAIAADPAHVSAFLGTLTGTMPVNEFFSPGHLRRVVGTGGLARMLWRRLTAPKIRATSGKLSPPAYAEGPTSQKLR